MLAWIKSYLTKFKPEVLWQGSTPFNYDLKVVNFDGERRIVSGNYTQSKNTQQIRRGENYWKKQVEVCDLSKIEKPRILILGLGGGTIASLFQEKYQDVMIDGVEIDRKMVELGEKYLGLKKERLNIFIEDAQSFVNRAKGKYDLICVDIFETGGIPNQFKTKAFYLKLRALLREKGMVTANRIFNLTSNIFDLGDEGREDYNEFLQMLESVFREVDVVVVKSDLANKNYIFRGSS